MKLYPIMLDVTDKLTVVVGGGDVALRKITGLLDSGAMVRVISTEFHTDIEDLYKKNKNKLSLTRDKYSKDGLEGAVLVYSATDDIDVNRQVYEDALEKKIPVNVVDDPSHCSFYVPSSTDRGDLIIAVSTSGASPAFSAKFRRELEKNIPDNIESILESLRKIRDFLKSDPKYSDLSSSKRSIALKKIVNNDQFLSELSNSNKKLNLREFLDRILS